MIRRTKRCTVWIGWAKQPFCSGKRPTSNSRAEAIAINNVYSVRSNASSLFDAVFLGDLCWTIKWLGLKCTAAPSTKNDSWLQFTLFTAVFVHKTFSRRLCTNIHTIKWLTKVSPDSSWRERSTKMKLFEWLNCRLDYELWSWLAAHPTHNQFEFVALNPSFFSHLVSIYRN